MWRATTRTSTSLWKTPSPTDPQNGAVAATTAGSAVCRGMLATTNSAITAVEGEDQNRTRKIRQMISAAVVDVVVQEAGEVGGEAACGAGEEEVEVAVGEAVLEVEIDPGRVDGRKPVHKRRCSFVLTFRPMVLMLSSSHMRSSLKCDNDQVIHDSIDASTTENTNFVRPYSRH